MKVRIFNYYYLFVFVIVWFSSYAVGCKSETTPNCSPAHLLEVTKIFREYYICYTLRRLLGHLDSQVWAANDDWCLCLRLFELLYTVVCHVSNWTWATATSGAYRGHCSAACGVFRTSICEATDYISYHRIRSSSSRRFRRYFSPIILSRSSAATSSEYEAIVIVFIGNLMEVVSVVLLF